MTKKVWRYLDLLFCGGSSARGLSLKHEKRNKNEIGINSIRGGNIVGEHTVQFFGEYETFEIKHTSYSRNLFAEGALKAADFIVTKSNGLYNMEDMFK